VSVAKSMNGVQLVKKLGQNLKVPSTKISSAELVKKDRYVNDSSFIDFTLFKLGLLYLLVISAFSFSPLMNI
jgi:hypothetical protein